MQLCAGEAVQRAEQPAGAVHDKDNELAGMRVLQFCKGNLKPPLQHIEAKHKIHDLLHINLRITAGMYYDYTVQCHCATPEYMQALRQWMFDELGITVNSKKRKNKKQDAVSIG
eukprot:jgi/Tetstr1/422876/TSEL_013667.t1